MSETARAGGMPGEIDFDGRRLKVERVTFRVEGIFERWLEMNLAQALERARPFTSEQVYRERLEAANRQAAAREFAWDDPGGLAQRAAWAPAGFRELSYHCLALLQPAWTREEHERLLAVPEKVQELARVIHQITDPHPNGSAPGAGASGATTSPVPNSSAPSSPSPSPA